MLLAGLTGGVGAGKSTVGRLLERHGAVILDADAAARAALQPGTIGYQAVVARFGRDVLLPDRAVDRKALADLIFSDDDARADLNGIVHPLVRASLQEQTEAWRGSDAIVVLMVPLLVESGRYKTDFVIVVDCDEDVAIARLVADRGWTEKEARARIATQATRDERRSAADVVIDNSDDSGALAAQVDSLWSRLVEERDRS